LPSRSAAGRTRLDLTMQTNGVLLTERRLDVLLRQGIRVGVSLDGDRVANDRHRRYATGRSSNSAVLRGLALLQQNRFSSLFAGLLCTVDLRNDPIATYESLISHGPPTLDFLLPHGNWMFPPAGLAGRVDRTPYGDWLAAVFDRWYSAPRREVGIRLFESIVSRLFGGGSASRAIGPDDASILVVETDGSIEAGDALKTTPYGTRPTQLCVRDHSLDDAQRALLGEMRGVGLAGLTADCLVCPVVAVCGGGLDAHRYSADRAFDNRSVYCADLYRLITHIDRRLRTDLGALVPTGT
jgi:uncharacterized protein